MLIIIITGMRIIGVLELFGCAPTAQWSSVLGQPWPLKMFYSLDHNDMYVVKCLKWWNNCKWSRAGSCVEAYFVCVWATMYACIYLYIIYLL